MTRLGWFGAVAGLALAACSQSSGDAQQGQADDEEVLSAIDSYKDFGDYTLHFNALTTDQLPAQAAESYGIVRSKNRVLLNIVILRDEEIGAGKPVVGKVTASARNLTGQLKQLNVSEVKEGEAIYYLAQTQIVNAETLVFTVEATPDSTTTPLKVVFQKQFFVDE